MDTGLNRAKKIKRHMRAAIHEIHCKECRVSWDSWLWRLTGGDYQKAKRLERRRG